MYIGNIIITNIYKEKKEVLPIKYDDDGRICGAGDG